MANNFISASSIKERVNNNTAIEAMNGNDALYSYLNEMEYFAAYAENVRDINRIFKDPNIKDAIELADEQGLDLVALLFQQVGGDGRIDTAGQAYDDFFTRHGRRTR